LQNTPRLTYLPPAISSRSPRGQVCLILPALVDGFVAALEAERRQAMSYSISTLLTRNLHDVFGENDPARRRAAIDEIFTEDCVFYEPRGVYRANWQRMIALAPKADKRHLRRAYFCKPDIA
jgi:hypothetical protein